MQDLLNSASDDSSGDGEVFFDKVQHEAEVGGPILAAAPAEAKLIAHRSSVIGLSGEKAKTIYINLDYRYPNGGVASLFTFSPGEASEDWASTLAGFVELFEEEDSQRGLAIEALLVDGILVEATVVQNFSGFTIAALAPRYGLIYRGPAPTGPVSLVTTA